MSLHSCDEAFCDGCWRKVHGKGKRVFHPYSEVSPEGRIDARIYTMDGDQVGKNAAFSYLDLLFEFWCLLYLV